MFIFGCKRCEEKEANITKLEQEVRKLENLVDANMRFTCICTKHTPWICEDNARQLKEKLEKRFQQIRVLEKQFEDLKDDYADLIIKYNSK